MTLPFVIVQVGKEMMFDGVLEMVKQASAVLKPPPVMVTAVLNVPELGDKEICAEVTVNLAVPKSPVLPVTVIVYVPGVASGAIVKLVAVN